MTIRKALRRSCDPREGDVFASPLHQIIITITGRSPRRVDIDFDPQPWIAPICYRINEWRHRIVGERGYRLAIPGTKGETT